MIDFRRFIAIDWSGARDPGRGLEGLQVAACEPGAAPPDLVTNPAGGAWRRSHIARWLLAEARRAGPLLAGFDFAFAFPFCDVGAYMPGTDCAREGPFDLWELVDEVSLEQPDFYAGAFVEDGRFANAFWIRGPQPRRFAGRCRWTEKRCRIQGLGRPETVFKLIGGKQVGKGSLAGMRVLRHLRRNGGGAVRVWPFDEIGDGNCVCVEIFPRHFLSRAGLGGRKVRALEPLNRALRFFASDPVPGRAGDLSDHQTDALVSAAALRRLGADGAVWRPPSMTPCARAREGWIFGVR